MVIIINAVHMKQKLPAQDFKLQLQDEAKHRGKFCGGQDIIWRIMV